MVMHVDPLGTSVCYGHASPGVLGTSDCRAEGLDKELRFMWVWCRSGRWLSSTLNHLKLRSQLPEAQDLPNAECICLVH